MHQYKAYRVKEKQQLLSRARGFSGLCLYRVNWNMYLVSHCRDLKTDTLPHSRWSQYKDITALNSSFDYLFLFAFVLGVSKCCMNCQLTYLQQNMKGSWSLLFCRTLSPLHQHQCQIKITQAYCLTDSSPPLRLILSYASGVWLLSQFHRGLDRKHWAVFEETKSMDSSSSLNHPQPEYVFWMAQWRGNRVQNPCKNITISS